MPILGSSRCSPMSHSTPIKRSKGRSRESPIHRQHLKEDACVVLVALSSILDHPSYQLAANIESSVKWSIEGLVLLRSLFIYVTHLRPCWLPSRLDGVAHEGFLHRRLCCMEKRRTRKTREIYLGRRAAGSCEDHVKNLDQIGILVCR